MIRLLFDIILILFCFCMQQTFFQALSLGGIVPNLLLIITAIFGFVSGKREGMWVGFFCGLLLDIFYADIMGINALLYMSIGYYNGYYKGGFFLEDIKMPILYVLLSEIIYSSVYFVINFALRGRSNIFLYAKAIIIPELFYTLLVTLLLYRPLLFLIKKTNFDGE